MRKSKYAEIGRSGTADKFVEAFERVANPYWNSDAPGKKRKILADEGARAFCDGHPEKVQAVLAANPAKFGNGSYHRAFVADVLHGISEKSDDKPAAINLALAGVSEENRKEMLSRVMYDAMGDRDMCKESFVDALLKAGADPNTVIDGQAGRILFTAILCCRPEPVFKSLIDGGASIEAALTLSQTRDNYKKHTGSILLYQEKFAKKPAAAAEAQAEKLDRMEQRLQELTDEVRHLSSLLQAAHLVSPPDEAKEAAPDRNPAPHTRSISGFRRPLSV